MQRVTPGLFILALLALECGSLWGSDQHSRELAMSNPLLWSHFRRVALDARSVPGRRGRRDLATTAFALDAQTSNLIHSFLKRVESQSERLRSSAEHLAALTREGSPPSGNRFREALADLEKAADNLRSVLTPVFLEINRNVKVRRPEAFEIHGSADFYRAAEILSGEAFSAQRKVESYVFAGDNTVSVQQLGNSNMLVSLGRVGKMARSLQKVP